MGYYDGIDAMDIMADQLFMSDGDVLDAVFDIFRMEGVVLDTSCLNYDHINPMGSNLHVTTYLSLGERPAYFVAKMEAKKQRKEAKIAREIERQRVAKMEADQLARILQEFEQEKRRIKKLKDDEMFNSVNATLLPYGDTLITELKELASAERVLMFTNALHGEHHDMIQKVKLSLNASIVARTTLYALNKLSMDFLKSHSENEDSWHKWQKHRSHHSFVDLVRSLSLDIKYGRDFIIFPELRRLTRLVEEIVSLNTDYLDQFNGTKYECIN